MQLPQQSSFRTIILSLKFPQDYLQKKCFTEFSTVHIHDLKKNFFQEIRNGKKCPLPDRGHL